MSRIQWLGALLAICATTACAAGDTQRSRTASAYAGGGDGGDDSTGTAVPESDPTTGLPDNDLPPIDWDTDSGSSTGGDDTSGGEQIASTGGDEGGSESGSESTGMEEPGVPQPCDPEFSFTPAVPTTDPFYVEVSNLDPLVFVGVQMVGPTTLSGEVLDVVDDDPWAWRFSFEGQMPGSYVLEFSSAESADGPRTTWSSCTITIAPSRG